MIKRMYASVVLFTIFFSKVSYADVTIQSPIGGSITFSQKKMVSTTMIIHGRKLSFPIIVTLLISVGMTELTLKTVLQKYLRLGNI